MPEIMRAFPSEVPCGVPMFVKFPEAGFSDPLKVADTFILPGFGVFRAGR
jgi:hypothetical protein